MTASLKSREILDQFSFYAASEAGLRDLIMQHARPVVLEQGSFFFRAGAACACIPLVSRGDVRVFLSGESSREITLYHVEAGQTCLLTLNAALQNTIYAADAIVEAEVEALVIPVHTFRQWFDEYSTIRHFVLDIMSQRITELMTLVSEITFGRLDRRLADYLLRNFTQADTDGQVLSVTHEHIAAELGSVREVISRVLKEFERTGGTEHAARSHRAEGSRHPRSPEIVSQRSRSAGFRRCRSLSVTYVTELPLPVPYVNPAGAALRRESRRGGAPTGGISRQRVRTKRQGGAS